MKQNEAEQFSGLMGALGKIKAAADPRRLWCRLFACVQYENGAHCTRCGAYIYDEAPAPGYFVGIGEGLIRGPWDDLADWLRFKAPIRKCEGCDRWRYLPKDWRPCCSERCFDGWIPF